MNRAAGTPGAYDQGQTAPTKAQALSFRILALSGGGVRGVFQATFLRCLEQSLRDERLDEQFELVVGTSTGGILALAIAAGIPPARIRELYEQRAAAIFDGRFGAGFLRGPRYDSRILRRELEAVFGDRKLRDLRTPTVVTASALQTYTGSLISSIEEPDMALVDAALATSAAPTYFAPATPATGDRSYMDGGLWANDPSLVAILHAHHRMGIDLGQLRVLAVGTGQQPSGKPARELRRMRTYSRDAVTFVLELTMGSQASFARDFAAEVLNSGQLVIVNPVLQRPIALDRVEDALDLLPGLAEEEFNDHRRRIHALLAPAPALEAIPPPLPSHLQDPLREARVSAFYPSRRDYQRYRPGAGTIDTYVGTAISTLAMISVNLSTGMLISGLLEQFERMVRRPEKPVAITVSLIDPREVHLMQTLAPVLDTDAAELAGRISGTAGRLVEFRAALPRALRRYFDPRLHTVLPSASAIMLDHKLPDGRVQLETKPFQAGMQESFAFEVESGSALFATLVLSYEKVLTTGASIRQWP